MQLIIFDCDGVLVDSEIISNSIFCEILAESEIIMSYEECFVNFTGMSLRACVSLVENKFGKALPKDVIQQYKRRVMEKFKTND